MRRTAFVLVVLVAALSLAAVGCGGEENQSAAPESVQGETTTTETQTTESESTETQTTETGTTTSESTETETTPSAQGDPVAGKEVFLSPTAACGGCHTLADAGSSGSVGPNLDDAKPSFEKVQSQVTNGGGAMPPFKGTLTEQQIADVAAYVSSVAGQ